MRSHMMRLRSIAGKRISRTSVVIVVGHLSLEKIRRQVIDFLVVLSSLSARRLLHILKSNSNSGKSFFGFFKW